MSKNVKVQDAIKLLEKITGKRVILEYIPAATVADDGAEVNASAEDIAIDKSSRQKGADKAIETKGYQNWTPEQYAMCYFLKKYGKQRMPMPFKTMSLQQIADEMNAKHSTLGMNGENIKFLLTGHSSLESAGPKAANLVQKFETMSIDQVWRHARRAIEQGRLEKQVQNDPRLAGKSSTIGKKASDYKPEIAALINQRRAERGEAPLPESVIREAFNRLEEKKKLNEGPLEIKDVIQSYAKRINHALKANAVELASKLRAELKQWLENKNYAIERDPYAAELVYESKK